MNENHLALTVATAISVIGTGVALPATAHAQPRLGGPPPVTWITTARSGDNAGTGGRGDRLDELAIEPLRLGLTAGSVALGRLNPGCEAHPEATGTATAGVPGFPLQYTAAFRLVPRLTLFGMSRAGCARDSAIGVGVVYVVPLTPKIGLALGAGALALPNYGLGGSAVVRVQARTDIVFAIPGGRSVSVGLGTGSGGARLSAGGIF